VDAKNRTVVGHLRWRSQFAPEPARRFTAVMDHHAPRSFEVAVQYSSLQKMIHRKLSESEPAGLPLNPDVVRRTLKRRATAKGLV
jgi:hypothetical protein